MVNIGFFLKKKNSFLFCHLLEVAELVVNIPIDAKFTADFDIQVLKVVHKVMKVFGFFVKKITKLIICF